MHDWIAATLYPYLDATNDCILGCTDSNYIEYNADANVSGFETSNSTSTFNVTAPINENFNISGCFYQSYGCQDESACNYNINAIFSDTCIYSSDLDECATCSGQEDGTGTIIDNDSDNDGVCDENEVLGCTDNLACNFNNEATEDDNSCDYIEDGLSLIHI